MNRRDIAVLGLLLLVAACVFLPGINWGLPSRQVDEYLFRGRTPWTGREILARAGTTEDPDRGADVVSHASAERSIAVVVNANDEERARIVRRYRLMSYQPDEWNTLKALSEMQPGRGNLDPKLYQYGGLWVYPVGAMLKTASMLHLIDLRADVPWYLDHPEAFGRFYVVARLWSVIWALVGVFAVYALVRRIVGGWFFPASAALCFICMPVVVNMAHEAKPHLAGAVLTLLAVLAAARYVERGGRLAWITAGALCGAALGMVLTTLPVFLILPAMVSLRRPPWHKKFAVSAGATAIGVLVYLLTNPYVPINLVWHRTVLQSNFGNSKAMYHAQLTANGLGNACYLIAAGTSPLLALAGVAGAVALGIRAIRVRRRQDAEEGARRANGLLLAIPALCVIAQCLVFATNKPGEFGRFMLVADVFLAVEAIAAAATFLPQRAIAPGAAMIFAMTAAFAGSHYLRAFVRDSQSPTARLVEAARLRQLDPSSNRTIAVFADPAPYCLPPVDLFGGKILLLPKGAGATEGVARADLSVQAVDAPQDQDRWTSLWTGTPISWADKSFDVRVK